MSLKPRHYRLLLTRLDSYPAKDGPLFHTGAGVSLMSAIIQVASGACLSIYVLRMNRKKATFMSNVGIDHVVSAIEQGNFG